jgi:tripartite-type tricarboxylate transporter receptor subunit TctC
LLNGTYEPKPVRRVEIPKPDGGTTIAFNEVTGTNATILPYRGTAPALNDVAGGHIQLLIDPVLALLGMAQEKKIVGLAVTSAKRTRLAPDIPTIAEAGFTGFDHASWYGLWGPNALPRALVTTLNHMFNASVDIAGG